MEEKVTITARTILKKKNEVRGSIALEFDL